MTRGYNYNELTFKSHKADATPLLIHTDKIVCAASTQRTV